MSHPPKNERPRRIIIHGVKASGEVFRPRDWAERMSGRLSTFHKHRIRYSPLLQPTVRDGAKCVILSGELAESHPALYQSILEFAKANQLRIDYEDDGACSDKND